MPKNKALPLLNSSVSLFHIWWDSVIMDNRKYLGLVVENLNPPRYMTRFAEETIFIMLSWLCSKCSNNCITLDRRPWPSGLIGKVFKLHRIGNLAKKKSGSLPKNWNRRSVAYYWCLASSLDLIQIYFIQSDDGAGMRSNIAKGTTDLRVTSFHQNSCF